MVAVWRPTVRPLERDPKQEKARVAEGGELNPNATNFGSAGCWRQDKWLRHGFKLRCSQGSCYILLGQLQAMVRFAFPVSAFHDYS